MINAELDAYLDNEKLQGIKQKIIATDTELRR